MKKILIFLVFAVALIFYNVETIAPFLNVNKDEASNLPQAQQELNSSVNNNESNEKAASDQPVKQKTLVTDKPLSPAIRDAVRELVNTSHEGLVKEKTDNGVMLNLKGRFRTAPVATIGEDGGLTIRDYTAPPPE